MKHSYDGHRVYNGCPDSTLQARWDYEASLLKEIQNLSPGAKCCYFPMEAKYVVHDKNYNDISGYHHLKVDALVNALEVLRSKK